MNEAVQFIVKQIIAELHPEYGKTATTYLIDLFIYLTEVILSDNLEGEEEIEKEIKNKAHRESTGIELVLRKGAI